ncbi:hypothetical protein GCM10028807_37670 [Spirosoma daeguense]
MRLVELTTSQNFGYQAFFLNAVQKNRNCFRISPADDVAKSFPTNDKPDSFTLGLLTDSNTLAGVVSFEREGQDREKLRHKGLLFRMYVAPTYQGKGLGRILLESTIQRARLLPKLDQINLTVISTNFMAKRQYEKLGFRPFSFERNAVKDGDTYYDEEQMVLFLTDSNK